MKAAQRKKILEQQKNKYLKRYLVLWPLGIV